MSNKVVQNNNYPRVVIGVDATPVTPNVNTTDILVLTTLSQSTTIANPVGNPQNLQSLEIRITSASSEPLAWGSAYQGSSQLPLPTATTGGGLTDYYGFKYDTLNSKWDFLASAPGL